jgi:hypothetical protein
MALIRPGPLGQGALAPEAAKGGRPARFSWRCGSAVGDADFSGRRVRMQRWAMRIQPVFTGTQDLAVPQADKS